MNMTGQIGRDWHVHTWYSDGALSPAEVVSWAQATGLQEIAVTDHDGTGGIREAEEAGKCRGINIIRGIELSTLLENGTGLHILGYGIDPDNGELLRACREVQKSRQQRNERLLAALAEEGFPLTMADIAVRPEQDFVGKPVIARAMVRKGYINKPAEAFSGIFDTEKIRAIKKDKISVQKAIGLIRGAGGEAVLAHPGMIRHIGQRESEEFMHNLEQLAAELKSAGLGGIECDYAKHSSAEKKQFADIASSLGLDITRGSDFHGDDIR